MDTNSITIFKVIISKATRDSDSYQWPDPEGIKPEAIKGHLSRMANQLEQQVKDAALDEKIRFSVANTMPIEDPTVSLAINMHCILSSLTLEQWRTIGENIKKSLKSLSSKVNTLAESNTHAFPQIIVKDPQQLDMISEKVDRKAITVSSGHEKIILKTLINLAQSNNTIKYEIDGAESILQTLPTVNSVTEGVKSITRVVYVTYYDYLNTKFGIVFKSKNIRILDVRCSGLAQKEKLYAAYKLKCEARVTFSTTIITKPNGKTEEKITEILEVIEIFEDKKCPLQKEIDF